LNDNPTFIEMFSGVGGFRLGLERAGWKCIWANDWNKWANQIYRKNFGESELVEGDVKSVNSNSIPDHTLLTAGFPCQAFSIAGKRKGFEDTRGTLFYDITRIAKAKRSPLLLLENVKGLLSHDKGKTFAVMLQTLDELGYWTEWQVLNSKHFGVPQNRQRVFVVGHLGKRGGRKIFPIGETSKMDKRIPELKIAYCLDSNYWKGATPEHSIKKHTRQLVLQQMRIRRLTPVECERLQGFPDKWTDGVSDTQRYKLLGNAVTVNVTEFLGKRLKMSGVEFS